MEVNLSQIVDYFWFAMKYEASNQKIASAGRLLNMCLPYLTLTGQISTFFRFQSRASLAVISCTMIYLMGASNVAHGLVLGRSGGRPQALTTAATTSWARSQIGRGDSAEVAEGSTKATGKYPFLGE